jgi:DNA invertase Pin-like site-specific DNA recombinase
MMRMAIRQAVWGSGAKGRDKRPAFDKLCRDAARREFDMVMAWSVDRLGRSLQDLVGFLSELHALKIDLFLRQQGLDTTTPAGKAMFHEQFSESKSPPTGGVASDARTSDIARIAAAPHCS